MACRALRDHADPAHRRSASCRTSTASTSPDAVDGLDPRSTLFVVVLEDLHHARDADQRADARATGWSTGSRATPTRCGTTSWRSRPTPRRSRRSASTRADMLGFWDWVGGRYSVDSAIGLSLAIAIGARAASASSSAGFRAMDEHFRAAPLERNMPVLLGLLGVWNGNFLGRETPRGAALQRAPRALPGLPAAARHGEQRQVGGPRRARRSRPPRPDRVGRAGTNGQHAFYQLIHQGTRLVPADLIGVPPRRRGSWATTTTC